MIKKNNTGQEGPWQCGSIWKKARGGLGIFAPQDRDELGAIQGADSGFGDFFPAHFAMRAGISGFDGEHAVQKHDALGKPGSEVSVGATGGWPGAAW